MQKAQEENKQVYDQKRRDKLMLEPGNKVWLSMVNLKLACPSQKLTAKYVGPFEVKRKIHPVMLELVLPGSYKLFPVCHVSLLKPVVSDPFPKRSLEPPPPFVIEGKKNSEFEVELILDWR